MELATPTRWNSTFYMLQSSLQMPVPLLVFERDCSPLHKTFVPTASYEFLTKSEGDTIMSLLKVLSPNEIAV